MTPATPPHWRTSSHSGGGGGNCVEVAALPTHHVALRDSRHRDHGHLAFPLTEWRAFITATAHGEL